MYLERGSDSYNQYIENIIIFSWILIRDEMQHLKMFYFFHLPRADLRISSSSPPPPVEGEGEKQLEEQCPD